MGGGRQTRRPGSTPSRRRAVVLALTTLAATLAACATDVGAGAPSGVVVATYRSPGVDLGARRTFAIVTAVGVVSDAGIDPPMVATALVAAVTAHLEARGFVKVADTDPTVVSTTPSGADLAVNLTALQSDRTEQGYWLGLSGHAEPAAWGYAGYTWTYGWPWTPVAPRRGTVLVEVTDLSGATAAGFGGLGVGWAALAIGVAAPGDLEGQPVLDAVDRAFSQSPYLAAAP